VLTINPCPPPDDVDIVLPDGRRVHLASIDKNQAIAIFGEPLRSSIIENGATEYEEYGVKHVCEFVFKNGELARIHCSGGVKVINSTNEKSLKLPAKESDIRDVFGKPTSITYPKSQQP
jgi:hypothetical protein